MYLISRFTYINMDKTLFKIAAVLDEEEDCPYLQRYQWMIACKVVSCKFFGLFI